MSKNGQPRAYVLILTSAIILVMSLLLSVLLLSINTDSRRNSLYQTEFKLRVEILNRRNWRLNYLNANRPPVSGIDDIEISIDDATKPDIFDLIYVSSDSYYYDTSSSIISLRTYVLLKAESITMVSSVWSK